MLNIDIGLEICWIQTQKLISENNDQFCKILFIEMEDATFVFPGLVKSAETRTKDVMFSEISCILLC